MVWQVRLRTAMSVYFTLLLAKPSVLLTKSKLHVLLLLLLLHPFSGLFSGTTWVSRYQKGKTSLDLNEARDGGVLGCSGISWIICKQSASRSRQITAPTPHQYIFYFFQARCRDDNGSAGHGSRVKWVNKSEWVTWVTGQLTDGSPGSRVKKCDPLSSLARCCS